MLFRGLQSRGRQRFGFPTWRVHKVLKEKVDRGLFLDFEVVQLRFVDDEFASVEMCLEDSAVLRAHERKHHDLNIKA